MFPYPGNAAGSGTATMSSAAGYCPSTVTNAEEQGAWQMSGAPTYAQHPIQVPILLGTLQLC